MRHHHRGASALVRILPFLLAVAPAIAGGGPARQAPPAGPMQLVLTDAADIHELRSLVLELERRGASVRHFFPPGAAVGHVPETLDPAQVPALRGRVVVLRDPDAPVADPLARSRPDMLGVWRELAQPPSPPAVWSEPAELVGDVIGPSPDEPGFQAAPRGISCRSSAGTSSYLVGDVSVGIVMPESGPSSPDSETWDDARMDKVVAEVVQGCSVLTEQVLPWAGLDFVYDVQRQVPVTVEPIEMLSSQATQWAGEAAVALGHPSVGAYVRHLMEVHGTDWGVAAFVADSLNDADNRFADGNRFAFAYLGGPTIWMTYGNDGWGIDRMDSVFVHEMGHSFHALDEYASSDPRCDAVSGVLGIENQNAEAPGGCLSNVSCIMRGNALTSGADGSDPSAALLAGHCEWSQGQMGAWDRDGDGLADIRDVRPQSALDPVDPDPVASPDVTLTGLATALPDPDEAGPDRYAAHTLNRIARVEYRLDGGAWTEATGDWGDLCADFEVALTGLADGWHTVESRAIALVCEPDDVEVCDPPRERVEDTLASEDFYVNTDCTEDAYEDNDHPWQVPSVPSGTIGGLQLCAYDPDRYGVYLRPGASLDLRVDYSEPAVPLELALVSPDGTALGSATGSGGTASLSLPAASLEGVHQIVVSAPGEAETPYSLTVSAECVDDAREPNGSAAAASPLEPGTLTGLQICDGDEDWYVVGVGAGSGISASIDHQAALGNLDLALLDADLTLLDESATGADVESVAVAALPGGRYYLRVRGAGPDDDNRYDLALAVAGCLDDPYENDDDASQAGELASGRVTGRRVCAGDEDWYRVEVSEPSFLRAALTFSGADGDLDLEVRAPDGSLAGGSYGTGDVELVDLQRAEAGTYFVRVRGKGGAGNPVYGLEVVQSDPVLLFVAKRDQKDAILDWTNVGVDCYQVLRNDRPDTFAGGMEARTGLLGEGEEAGEDPNHWEDVGAIDGRKLYFYKVFPSFCEDGSLSLVKTADPYPVGSFGAVQSFALTIRNDGTTPATDLVVHDDMTPMMRDFRVTEIPAGATDMSSSTGGTFNRGYVEVSMPSLGASSSATVKFVVEMDPTGSANDKGNVMRNQALLTAVDGLSRPVSILSDDPSTIAYPDSTDIAWPTIDTTGGSGLRIVAFWNQDVNVSLRVVDPCGNVIGKEDSPSAVCAGQTGWVFSQGMCGNPWPWGWVDTIYWPGPDVPRGEYRVQVRFAGDRDSGDPCVNAVPEDVVVFLQDPNAQTRWAWVVLQPEDTAWQDVFTHTVP